MTNMLAMLNNIEVMAKRGNFSLPTHELTAAEQKKLRRMGCSVRKEQINWKNPKENTKAQKWHDMAIAANVAKLTRKTVFDDDVIVIRNF